MKFYDKFAVNFFFLNLSYPSIFIVGNEDKNERKKLQLPSLSPPKIKKNLYLLSDFDEIIYETPLLNIITVAPQLAAVLLLLTLKYIYILWFRLLIKNVCYYLFQFSLKLFNISNII